MKNKKINKTFISGIILLTSGVLVSLSVLLSNSKILGQINPLTMQASDLPYTNNSQTNVQGAIDELFNKSNTWIDPSTIKTNKTGKIFASSRGIVIRRGGETHFFKINNWAEEQTHIQQVFSGVSCDVGSSRVICRASDFYCSVSSKGGVGCGDYSDYSTCNVDAVGSVDCD